MLLTFSSSVYGQHRNEVTATLDHKTKEIKITQRFTYVNSHKNGLSRLYFNDWNHAYTNKNTKLAKRFAEEFNRSLHLAKDRERGHTTIRSIVDDAYTGLEWERVGNRDIIGIDLNKVLEPGESIQLFFTYTLKLPSAKFTSYGFHGNGDFYLKDWYLTPAVYDGVWRLYDNANLDDLYTDTAETIINLTYSGRLFLSTNFDIQSENQIPWWTIRQIKWNQQKKLRIDFKRHQKVYQTRHGPWNCYFGFGIQ